MSDVAQALDDSLKDFEVFVEKINKLQNALARVVLNQEKTIELLLASSLCNGHTLLVGVPGLAKTLLVKTFADAMDWDFSRIQFTPDLMPADITGYELLSQTEKGMEMTFRQGPLFANLILADEINRAPAKTQSALLEVMQEHRVTVGTETYTMEEPYFVVATQNPIEQEGTYPLPEAQLDRFLVELRMTYPDTENEEKIAEITTSVGLPTVEKLMNREEFMSMQAMVRKVPVSSVVVKYAVALASATRPDSLSSPDLTRKNIEWGAGPRASQAMVYLAKAIALIRGRSSPLPKDVADVALPVLRHRILLNYHAIGEGLSKVKYIEELIKTVPLPQNRI